MLNALSNAYYILIDLPGMIWLATTVFVGKWWYAHYH